MGQDRISFVRMASALTVLAVFCGDVKAASIDDYVGTPIEALFVHDGALYASGGSTVDGFGEFAIATDQGSVAGYLEEDENGLARWVVGASVGSDSSELTRYWTGRGWLASFAFDGGWRVDLVEPGNRAPGQTATDQTLLPGIVAFGVGLILYQIFMAGWRHRSLHL